MIAAQIGEKMVQAGADRLGQPFAHHFKPVNFCEDGTTTVEGCWETGLGQNGYDCSGFVIAAACDALGISVDRWPRDIRHVLQMMPHGDPKVMPERGDILLTQLPGHPFLKHTGIYTGAGRMLHADGRRSNAYVCEGMVDPLVEVRVLRLADIAIN